MNKLISNQEHNNRSHIGGELLASQIEANREFSSIWTNLTTTIENSDAGNDLREHGIDLNLYHLICQDQRENSSESIRMRTRINDRGRQVAREWVNSLLEEHDFSYQEVISEISQALGALKDTGYDIRGGERKYQNLTASQEYLVLERLCQSATAYARHQAAVALDRNVFGVTREQRERRTGSDDTANTNTDSEGNNFWGFSQSDWDKAAKIKKELEESLLQGSEDRTDLERQRQLQEDGLTQIVAEEANRLEEKIQEGLNAKISVRGLRNIVQDFGRKLFDTHPETDDSILHQRITRRNFVFGASIATAVAGIAGIASFKWLNQNPKEVSPQEVSPGKLPPNLSRREFFTSWRENKRTEENTLEPLEQPKESAIVENIDRAEPESSRTMREKLLSEEDEELPSIAHEHDEVIIPPESVTVELDLANNYSEQTYETKVQNGKAVIKTAMFLDKSSNANYGRGCDWVPDGKSTNQWNASEACTRFKSLTLKPGESFQFTDYIDFPTGLPTRKPEEVKKLHHGDGYVWHPTQGLGSGACLAATAFGEALGTVVEVEGKEISLFKGPKGAVQGHSKKLEAYGPPGIGDYGVGINPNPQGHFPIGINPEISQYFPDFSVTMNMTYDDSEPDSDSKGVFRPIAEFRLKGLNEGTIIRTKRLSAHRAEVLQMVTGRSY